MNLIEQIKALLARRYAPAMPQTSPNWLGQHIATPARKAKRAAVKLIGNRQWRRRNILGYALRDAQANSPR